MRSQNNFSGRHFYDGAKDARFKPHFTLSVLIFLVLFEVMTVVSAASGAILRGLSDTLFPENPVTADRWILAASLLSTAIIGAIVIVYCKFIEKRSVASIGLKKESCFKLYFIGLLIGSAAISAAVGFCYALGAVTYDGFIFSDAPMYALICVGWIVQGAEEEIVFRGWFMSSLTNSLPIWAAVLINSVFFSLTHILNSGFGPLTFVNLMLMGIWLSLMAIRCDSIIPCCAAHTVWNLAQSCIFGLHESEAVLSVWRFSFTDNRGLSTAGVLAETVTVIVFILVTWFFPRFKKEKEIT